MVRQGRGLQPVCVVWPSAIPGDVKPVGEGISELLIHYGPGYRVYYIQRGTVLILLLCGGDKSAQDRDIQTAKRLAKETE